MTVFQYLDVMVKLEPNFKNVYAYNGVKKNGNLYQYLQKSFSTLKWNEDKLKLLVEISSELKIVYDLVLYIMIFILAIF